MGINIYPIPLGFDSCYIIQDKGVIMIDSGAPKKVKDFIKGIERVSIKPEEVQLIVITHGHWDHIGSAKEIKEITGAKIAMHQREKDWLEKSSKPMPPGVTLWGRIFSTIMKMFLPLVHIPSTEIETPILMRMLFDFASSTTSGSQGFRGFGFHCHYNAFRIVSAEKGSPCAGYIVLIPWSISSFQLSFTFCKSSAKIGKPGLRRNGNLFIAKSPTKTSPVSNRTLTDPEE